MLSGFLDASLSENILPGKEVGILRMKEWLEKVSILNAVFHFEIWRYYQKEQIVNCVYSRNNLPKVKDETCVINLDE